MTSGEHILIAGPSGSGKSTVAQLVGAEMNMPILSLDDYFLRGVRCDLILNEGFTKVRHWEHPRQYDGARLAADVRVRGRPCVVEGFVIFQYPEIIELGGLRVYLDVPLATAMQRRMDRRPRRRSDEAFAIVGEYTTAKWVSSQLSEVGGIMPVYGEAPRQVARQIVDEWLARSMHRR